MPFTTWGPLRGPCNHLHRCIETAEACIRLDKETHPASDREIRGVKRHELAQYDPAHGPGRRPPDGYIPEY